MVATIQIGGCRVKHIQTNQLAQRLQAIFSEVLQPANKGFYDEWLWRYYGHLATEAGSRTRVRYVADLCRLARFCPQDKVILDAGCGFGAVSIIFALMGARKVWGVDISERMLDTFNKIIHRYELGDCIETRLTSVTDTGIPDRSVDMVLSNEAISHFDDVDGFLRESVRVLVSGGVILIADGNNGSNPWIARFTQEVWNRFENGPVGQVHGHRVSEPYVETRRWIIRSIAPDLSESAVEQLARNTFGMVKAEIAEAIRKYQQSGEMPDSIFAPGRVPRNPESGAYIERLFKPSELARHIEAFGFDARYYAYFGGAKGNPLIRVINAAGMALTPFSISFARAFRIVARRR